ncbi:phage fiber-tail adaptor protein [Sinorhizobium meliloti]|uniref:phage fiber-tail adaptor protein n=1 Tax=Rhizobium meliloti TaxID=382 RepID=UPI003F5CDB72
MMQKAPADVLDFDIDFSRWLREADRITGATSELSGTTATIVRTDFTDSTARVWLADGTDGDSGLVTTTVVTEQGRTKQFCFNIKIRECR